VGAAGAIAWAVNAGRAPALPEASPVVAVIVHPPDVAPITRPGEPAGLRPDATVAAGEWIETRGSRGAALRTLDQTSVRLDAGTRLRWIAPSVIELQRGAVYLDTAEGARPLEIRTPYGSATDLGTQFEVRVQPGAVRVRVRSGAVAISRDGRTFEAVAGTEMTVTGNGAETRPVSTTGGEWTWTAALAPPVAFDGSTLTAYLSRVAREHGWVIAYADAATARAAERAVLRGSVEGLGPLDAVDIAIGAAGLAHAFDRGRLDVWRAGAEGAR
jgi:hypothetical protein